MKVIGGALFTHLRSYSNLDINRSSGVCRNTPQINFSSPSTSAIHQFSPRQPIPICQRVHISRARLKRAARQHETIIVVSHASSFLPTDNRLVFSGCQCWPVRTVREALIRHIPSRETTLLCLVFLFLLGT